MARPLPVIQEPASSLRKDGGRNYVHPADVSGRFQRLRRVGFAVLILVYLALPFVRVDGHPAIFLDVARRRFYLFGQTFNAQDFWLAFFLLTGAGFALIVATTLYGRVWCGYACPQTVFLEGIYRPIERLLEGPRNERLKRNAGPLTFDKVWRKGLKQIAFVAVSLFISHFVLSYFVSLPSLFQMMRGRPREHWEAFVWMAAMSAVLYFDFAWFREQVCLAICPYGRLQSAMTDRETIVIGYDVRRGEPRTKIGKHAKAVVAAKSVGMGAGVTSRSEGAGVTSRSEGAGVTSRSEGAGVTSRSEVGDPRGLAGDEADPRGLAGDEADPRGAGPGDAADCVDCKRCVVVCPTGIDIRNGLQMECIGCAACVDACDDVMRRIDRAPGLVRYDSLNGLEGTPKPPRRGRLYLYAVLGVVGLGVALFSFRHRAPFEANLLRGAVPFGVTDGEVRNALDIHLINKRPDRAAFVVEASGDANVEIIVPVPRAEIASLGSMHVPLLVRVPREAYRPGLRVRIRIREDGAAGATRTIEAPVLGPAR